MKGRRRNKTKEHKDSTYPEERRKVTFSKGRNASGARVNGKKQILKKKVKIWE
jgi:hypothetical protein